MNDSYVVCRGMIAFMNVKKQELLEFTERYANWGYFCHQI